MSFRDIFSIGLTVAAAALAGCTQSTAGGGTGGSMDTGAGGQSSGTIKQDAGLDAQSLMVKTDIGACTTGASTPLSSTTLHMGGFQYAGALTQVITFNLGGGQLWTGTITDQSHYQPFQDYGLPAVDFTASEVLVVAATNGCGGTADATDLTVTSVSGAPHLEATYSILSIPGGDACLCEFISVYTLLAVQVPVATAMPAICIHEITGC